MYVSISENNELENEMPLDMSYFWYSDALSLSLSLSLIYVMTVFVIQIAPKNDQFKTGHNNNSIDHSVIASLTSHSNFC